MDLMLLIKCYFCINIILNQKLINIFYQNDILFILNLYIKIYILNVI